MEGIEGERKVEVVNLTRGHKEIHFMLNGEIYAKCYWNSMFDLVYHDHIKVWLDDGVTPEMAFEEKVQRDMAKLKEVFGI